MKLMNTNEINELRDRGAIFYVSHSGGKDSQAMYALVRKLVPDQQIVVMHANLGEVEWPGVVDHIRANCVHQVNVVGAAKSFFDMVRRRHATRPDAPCWPSPSTRQCTSDLKRDPLQKFMRADMKERGALLAVNCVGLRAQESSGRAKQLPLKLNKSMSKAGREVYDWLPIHQLTTVEVFAAIAEAGQEPFWAYQDGNDRLSCMFCIMGCKSDLKHAARVRPDLYQAYLDLEAETGYTMFHKASLRDLVEG
jgi:DNA sulfur modification protein DndC